LTPLPLERWKVIPKFPEYEVSDLGRVRHGNVVLKNCLSDQGYAQVNLWAKGRKTTKKVHRLVAQAFIPNPKRLREVNHLGEKHDCRYFKLEWRSTTGNNLYKMQNEEGGKGVYLYKRTKRWMARYGSGKNCVYLGYFATKKEAIKARRRAVASLPHIL